MSSKLDRTDHEILQLLMEDGRMSSAEIARRTHSTSERSVRYRIERMVREGVIHVSALPDPRALGYSVVADLFIEVEPMFIGAVATQLAALETVIFVALAIGESDIHARVIGRDNKEVHALATEVVGKMEGVRKTTTAILPQIIKDFYQWRIPFQANSEQFSDNNSNE